MNDPLPLTPEQELCVLFARLSLQSQESARARFLLRKGVDWESLIRLTNHHRIMPLAYFQMKRFQKSWNLSSFQLKPFRENFQNHGKRNKAHIQKIQKFLRLLEHENVGVVLLKGLCLIPEVFRLPALRPMSDCDLLIQRKDLKKVESLLQKVGYQREEVSELLFGERWLPGRRFAEILNTGTLSLFCPGDYPFKNYLCMDLHVSLFRRKNILFEEETPNFWKRKRRANFFGIPCWRLSPSDELLFLCCHLYFHALDIETVAENADFRLMWFCDIRELLMKNPSLSLNKRRLSLPIQNAVQFVRSSLAKIYGNQSFLERLSKSNLKNENVSNKVLWRVGEEQRETNFPVGFWERMFRTSFSGDLQSLREKIRKSQQKEFFGKLEAIGQWYGKKKVHPCMSQGRGVQ